MSDVVTPLVTNDTVRVCCNDEVWFERWTTRHVLQEFVQNCSQCPIHSCRSNNPPLTVAALGKRSQSIWRVRPTFYMEVSFWHGLTFMRPCQAYRPPLRRFFIERSTSKNHPEPVAAAIPLSSAPNNFLAYVQYPGTCILPYIYFHVPFHTERFVNRMLYIIFFKCNLWTFNNCVSDIKCTCI